MGQWLSVCPCMCVYKRVCAHACMHVCVYVCVHMLGTLQTAVRLAGVVSMEDIQWVL